MKRALSWLTGLDKHPFEFEKVHGDSHLSVMDEAMAVLQFDIEKDPEPVIT